RIEHVALGEEQLATDDFRARDAVDGVGGPSQEGRLRVLEDVLRLDVDVSDARWGLRGRRGDRDRRGKQGPEEKRADVLPAPVQGRHTKIRGMRAEKGASACDHWWSPTMRGSVGWSLARCHAPGAP